MKTGSYAPAPWLFASLVPMRMEAHRGAGQKWILAVRKDLSRGDVAGLVAGDRIVCHQKVFDFGNQKWIGLTLTIGQIASIGDGVAESVISGNVHGSATAQTNHTGQARKEQQDGVQIWHR